MRQAPNLPRLALGAVSGLLFGAGLYVSQMIDPLKVLRFLDITAIPSGGWDPSLALVMAPAVIIMFAAVRISSRWNAPVFDARFHGPAFSRVDAPLVAGSALFGIGWGMCGICPGPAIALIAFWPRLLLVFLLALLIGSYAVDVAFPRSRGSNAVAAR